MKRKFFIPTLAIALFIVTGCRGSRLSGHYVDLAKPTTYIDFHDDGTTYAEQDGFKVTGSYKIDGDSVIISWSTGLANKGQIHDNTITSDGVTFTHQ